MAEKRTYQSIINEFIAWGRENVPTFKQKEKALWDKHYKSYGLEYGHPKPTRYGKRIV